MDSISHEFEPESPELAAAEVTGEQDADALSADIPELTPDLVPSLDLALSPREATARSCGYSGSWPPIRPSFEEAEDDLEIED